MHRKPAAVLSPIPILALGGDARAEDLMCLVALLNRVDGSVRPAVVKDGVRVAASSCGVVHGRFCRGGIAFCLGGAVDEHELAGLGKVL